MSVSDWKTLESKYLIRDNWLTVRVDKCQMPDGRVVEPYYVLEYPTWVNVVAITEQNEIVLTRQYRHGLGKTVLELPCGNTSENETPESAIKRELLEETGYTGDNFVETGVVSANPAILNNLTHCFLTTGARFVSPPELDETEQIEVALVPLAELDDLIKEGKIFQALHISSIFLAQKKLGDSN